MSPVSTATETVTFEVKTTPGEVIRKGNHVDAQGLRVMYQEAEMSCDDGEIQSLAEVFASEEVREGFIVTDDEAFLPLWEEFAQEHGLLLVR